MTPTTYETDFYLWTQQQALAVKPAVKPAYPRPRSLMCARLLWSRLRAIGGLIETRKENAHH